MKMTKKCLAMLLAIVMLFAFSVPALAANADLSGHTYVTYQIFSGTQADDDPSLAKVEWGSGINGAAFLEALRNSTAFGRTSPFVESESAKDVAVVLQAWGDDSAKAKAFAKLAYQYKTKVSGGTSNLDAGYYLVVDVTEFDEDDVNTVYNLALLQLTQKGGFSIQNKVSVPEVQKKVKNVDDSEGITSGWQDAADFDIGDNVPFMLTARLATISDYDTYKVVFHDTLSGGLTYNGDAVVKVDGATVQPTSIDYVGNALTVTIDNVKTLGAEDESRVTVEYTARLNENAVVGVVGNPNSVYLEYSNNPNESATGTPSTGKTPTDQVIVFTYKVVVNKIDQDENPLAGATFELFKKVEGVEVSCGYGTTSDDGCTFTWAGVDNGEYVLREITAPKGYNQADDISFTISAEYDIVSNTPGLYELNSSNKQFATNVNAGSLTASVINEMGIVLPETGGIGTTIFYILGAILLIGASVVLIARKRMTAEQ